MVPQVHQLVSESVKSCQRSFF